MLIEQPVNVRHALTALAVVDRLRSVYGLDYRILAPVLIRILDNLPGELCPDRITVRKRRKAAHFSADRLALAVLTLTLIVGALLRLDAVSSSLPADKYAGSDVARYYVSTAESFMAGNGWLPAYEYNFIPPPLQAAFIVVVKSLAPNSNYSHIRYVQALLSIVTIVL